jgi:hypothetical protein
MEPEQAPKMKLVAKASLTVDENEQTVCIPLSRCSSRRAQGM